MFPDQLEPESHIKITGQGKPTTSPISHTNSWKFLLVPSQCFPISFLNHVSYLCLKILLPLGNLDLMRKTYAGKILGPRRSSVSIFLGMTYTLSPEQNISTPFGKILRE